MKFTTSGLFFLQMLDIKFVKDSPSNFWVEDVNGRWRTPTHSNNSSGCLGWPKNRYENQDQKPNCSLVNSTKFCIAYLLFLYVEQVIFELFNLKYAPIGRKTYMYINWALFYIFKYKKLNKPTHQKRNKRHKKPKKQIQPMHLWVITVYVWYFSRPHPLFDHPFKPANCEAQSYICGRGGREKHIECIAK